jgi:hypothetical protein
VPVLRPIGGERFELHQERRHEVERHADVRKLAQQRDHAVVVLEGMKADPRQHVLVGGPIFVIRLVHVPQDGDARHTVSV